MIDFILQNPFEILLALIFAVGAYGLISSDRAVRRNHQELVRLMSMIEFNVERCCDCDRRESCQIYIKATGFTNEEDQS